MSGFIPSPSSIMSSRYKSPEYRKSILSDLLLAIKECVGKYGNKPEMATEADPKIVRLCDCWEVALCHGIVNTNVSSVLKNVTDIVTSGQVEMPNFWEFAYIHMQNHERERFSSLTHVWTDRGKTRALIRNALNEWSLERYILTWLADPSLAKSYESWAMMRDPVASKSLASMAADLSSILFALSIDNPELNAVKLVRDTARPEPIIAAPSPPVSGPSKKSQSTKTKSKRQIIDFDNDDSVAGGTPPKETLSAQCLKQDDPHVSPSQVFNIHEELPSEIQTFVCRPTPPSSRMSTSITSERSIVRTELFPDLPPAPSTSRFLCEDFTMPPSSATDSGVETSSSRIEEPNNDGDEKDGETHSVPSNASSKHSSVHSSAMSLDMERLKNRLKDAEERCQWLESRVAQLSLENHRLKGISNSPRGGLTYFTVSVPRVHLENNKYYSYEIHISPTYGGEEWTIRKRYRDFYDLHQAFQKTNPGVKTLDFPPKKNFGNMDASFVEQRRQRLQVYLRHLLAILPEVSTCNTRTELEDVFPFFK